MLMAARNAEVQSQEPGASSGSVVDAGAQPFGPYPPAFPGCPQGAGTTRLKAVLQWDAGTAGLAH